MTAAPSFSHATRTSRAAGLAWLLALAVVLAATLGHLHRVMHDPAPAAGAHVHDAHAAASHDGHHAHAHGLLALFGGHDDGDLQCRLYDQLAHGSAMPSVAALLPPVVLPTAVFDFMQGEALARWVLLFDARGPPPAR